MARAGENLERNPAEIPGLCWVRGRLPEEIASQEAGGQPLRQPGRAQPWLALQAAFDLLNHWNRLTIRSTRRISARHNASQAMLPRATSSQNSEMTRPAQDRMSCRAWTCDVAKADTQHAVDHQVEVGPLPELAQLLLKVIMDLLEHLEVAVGDIGVALTGGAGDREIGAGRSVRKIDAAHPRRAVPPALIGLHRPGASRGAGAGCRAANGREAAGREAVAGRQTAAGCEAVAGRP